MDEKRRFELKRQAGNKNGLPLWCKLFALVLTGLVISRLLGMQVFVEISYDGLPFLASLTDVRIYFVPLFLILLYILLNWIWKILSGSGNHD